MLSEFCSFVETIYGGKHWIETDALGLTVLYIENDHDRFRIHLADKVRFGEYTLYHRNSGRRLDGTWPYHRQCKAYTLGSLIFTAYAHSFEKANGIWKQKGDYQALIKDWKRFLQN